MSAETASLNKAQRLRAEIEQREQEAAAIREERVRASRARAQKEARRAVPGIVKRCLEEAESEAAENRTSASVHVWGYEAQHAAEKVCERLEAEGFTVTARPDFTAVRINGDGFADGGSDPYCVFELSW